jgi:hypothetical protein
MAFEPSVAVFDACILYPFISETSLSKPQSIALSNRAGRMRSTTNGSRTWRPARQLFRSTACREHAG